MEQITDILARLRASAARRVARPEEQQRTRPERSGRFARASLASAEILPRRAGGAVIR